MSMVVKNNMSAVHTLNTLNNNSSALQKSLAKVSSGMKINSAQDDASGYAISERMRVQIRSLDQANSNAQNASSLIKTAEGAVGSTLDIVRTMKEKAINAATDTNTDQDRLTIQKEMDQYIDQVDDNSLVTFNGQILLDGSSMPFNNEEYTNEQNIVRGLNSAWIQDAIDLISESYGLDFTQNGNQAKSLKVVLDTDTAASGTLASCGGSFYSDGTLKDGQLTLTIYMNSIGDVDKYSQDGKTTGSSLYLDRTIAHELTHGVMYSKFAKRMLSGTDSLPSWIIEGGTAELVHGADTRDLTASLTNSNTFKTNVFDATGTGAAAGDAYAGGFVAMRYMAKNANANHQEVIKNFMNALDRGGTVDQAFSAASGGKWATRADFENAMLADIDRYAGNATAFLKEKCGIDTSNDDTGSITGSDAGTKLTKTAKSVVHEVGSTTNWRLPSSTSTLIGGLEVIWPAGMSVTNGAGGGMAFHIGPKANDTFKVGFNDMRAKAIGLYDEEGEKLNITTQAKARAAISTLDKVVNIVVDQQANIGAMLQRLDYTSANLTTSSENVQAAESTIRDADMAKEMTNYTKNNVLLQAAQSMLAQANQNSSAVLSLLQ
ncbi:MAG: flagellinolysin [Selenomonadaceae bacterium]|nr:flagellinolysin [Selenomonadaceae bacterium]